MLETHERLRSRTPWRSRVIVLAVMTISYGALFYGMAHMRAPPDSIANSPPMFTPIVSEVGEERRGLTSSESWRRREQAQSEEQEQLIPPPRHWKFSPVDLLPSAPGRGALLSEFTPVTDASPDPPETLPPLRQGEPGPQSVPRRSALRMVRWFRPVYDRSQCTFLREDGLLVLDLLIDPSGRADEIKIAQSSGSTQLDGTALNAARLWRFAPPLWKARPGEVWGRVELRFNC